MFSNLNLLILLTAFTRWKGVICILPFQVNSIKSCDTKISIDRTTVNGITRGDPSAPCAGYMKYTDANGLTDFMIVDPYDKKTDGHAQRACYTLGVNYWRESTIFSSSNRQMMLYKCFNYEEEGIGSLSEGDDIFFYADFSEIGGKFETGCSDHQPNPFAYQCYDECYHHNSLPSLSQEEGYAQFLTLGCSDFNECLTGVRDYCNGPFESNCVIRKACGKYTDCTNHPGSFECTCKVGYEGSISDPYDLDKGCTDIKECAQDKCNENADCTNTIGSYFCVCKEGYTGDGHDCEKIECRPRPDLPNTAYYGGYYKGDDDDFEAGDTYTYKCKDGHQVTYKNMPENLLDFYGYDHKYGFTLTCNMQGDWEPTSYPTCDPVFCGDPGVVLFSNRIGNGFLFGQKVLYQSAPGYRTKGGELSFERTCQADGIWTDLEVFVDVDECVDTLEVCGTEALCINSPGSYVCLPYFPESCDLQNGLSLCKNGDCEMRNGKAFCRCDRGYNGILCENKDNVEEIDTALILALTGLVVLGILIIIQLMWCCARRRPTVPALALPEIVYGNSPPIPILPKRVFRFGRPPRFNQPF